VYLLNNSFIECVVRSLDLFSCVSISHLAVVLLSFFIRRKKTISINSGIRPTINRSLELIYKLQVHVVCSPSETNGAQKAHSRSLFS
jgi:hypothetical protein